MRQLRAIWARLKGSFHTGPQDQELADELDSHLQMAIDDGLRRGLSADEARRAALVRSGGLMSATEIYRDRRGVPLIEQTVQDLRYGARQILTHPGFACVAVATLALGIGANAAIFSVVHAVLLADPPYVAPDRLVRLTESFPAIGDTRLGTSPPEYVDYRDRTRTFASMGGYSRATFELTGTGEAAPIDALQATASLFATLGVSPHIGRTFTIADEGDGAPKVAVLSFAFWQRRYAGSPQALGQAMRLNEQPYTIVGVMPPGFEFPAGQASVAPPPAVWLPLSFTPRQMADRAASFGTQVVARLATGVSVAQARDDARRVAAEFQREHPDIYTGNIRVRAEVDPLAAEASARARPLLLILVAAVGVVLLAACANVANLLLVRASARQKEMAVRRALGAGRGRIVRQLLTETLLLTGLGGLLGCLLAVGLTRAAATLWHGQIISFRGVQVGGAVLAFVLGLSMLTGLLCGIAPAFELGRQSVGDTLKRAGRLAGGGRERRRLRSALVVFEAAAALLLLVGAALLVHSFMKVLTVPLGFDPNGVVVARTAFNRVRYPDAPKRHATQRLIVERLAALPGVKAVGLTTHLPLADVRTIGFFLPDSDSPQQAQWGQNALVSPEYFAAMGIAIVRGRAFSHADDPDTPLVAIVNETLARRYWPDRDVLGERLLWGGRRLTIVGVAADVHIAALDASVEPTIYCPVYQIESGATTSAVLIVRTRDGDAGAAAGVRAAMQSVDAGLPTFDVRPMSDVVGRSLAQRRFTMVVLTAFAGFALALAIVGLYAVLSQGVAQRTQELGVRLALGAKRRDLIAMVMRDAVRLVAAGLAIGTIAALGAARTLSVLLFGVDGMDPTAFAVAAGTLLGVSLLASYRVARRAADVDPIRALRAE